MSKYKKTKKGDFCAHGGEHSGGKKWHLVNDPPFSFPFPYRFQSRLFGANRFLERGIPFSEIGNKRILICKE